MQTKASKTEKRIPLMEMFGPTVQGEGAMIGVQTYFFRFGLCDYKCLRCDSMHAVDPLSVRAHAEFLTQHEIMDKWRGFWKPNTTRWITFSGGNPCIHDLGDLVALLTHSGFAISVETQGTFCPDWLRDVHQITVSPKGPGLGEKLELDKLDAFVKKITSLSQAYRPHLALKVVVFDQRDLEIARAVFERYTEVVPLSSMYLSLGNPFPPGQDEDIQNGKLDLRKELARCYRTLLEDIQQDALLSNVKFLPQWHVFVWENQKGV